MRGTYFESFLAGGLTLLVIAALAIALLLWRREDRNRTAIAEAFRGAGEEFRLNMHQTLRQLADLKSGRIGRARDLPVMSHPQLDGVLAAMIPADKRALAGLRGVYTALEDARARLRHALDEGKGLPEALEDGEAAAVHGICTLYLWECHDGRAPQEARSTRSRHVRDWLKANGYSQTMVPGMALRDEVVDCLRRSGMALTPRPLTHSAHEYYALGAPGASAARPGAADAAAPGVVEEAEQVSETPPPVEEPPEPALPQPDPEEAGPDEETAEAVAPEASTPDGMVTPSETPWQDLMSETEEVSGPEEGEDGEEEAAEPALPAGEPDAEPETSEPGGITETGARATKMPAWARQDETSEKPEPDDSPDPAPGRRRIRSRRR